MSALIDIVIDFFSSIMPYPVGEKNNMRDILIVFGLFIVVILAILLYLFVFKK